MSANRPSHLVVATLGRAVGLRGEVEVAVHTDNPERLQPGSRLLMAPENRPLTVRSARRTRSRTVIAFEELADRDAAEAVRGRDLVIPVEAARPLSPGEYWDHELTGCTVVTTAGDTVGEVAEVLHMPANDVIVVRGPEDEHLVPLVSTVVADVDVGSARITIEPLPGLLDDDA